MSDLLNVSSSPHVRSKVNTSNLMLMVVIALLPASIFGVYNFGIHALLVILVSVAACVLTEWLYNKGMKKTQTIGDYSAVVTGILLALNMPPAIALWIPALGGVFAILVVKQLFGGLGQNFMNPALAGRCFLMISFTGKMTDFTLPSGANSKVFVDAVTAATPLANVKSGEGTVDVMSMFVGNIQGTIGETSVIAILIGAAFLLFMKVIDLRIPLTYIGSFTVFVAIYSMAAKGGLDINYIAAHLCGGGLMLGAWFMATDYVTTPITKKGQLVYGCLLGIVTAVFRIFGGSAEGVSYAIIFCNLLIPLIERVTIPTALGKGGQK
ncbi:MAG: RnfABCDGE type electron transport complex subunit D [Lachnospiraceae bacterium]|jgi:electron transport complex protein RnfD|nr:RnfABCDGE type electron transport complex subunit D [Lachnospiraceae bacterium]MCI9389196.1 RnfABCDGE type electron transport complex subunit D [Lachnospiraceae bacterium]MCI9470947.1 RnfABCDGE type electron transport complex subunit D [Lachnospiraceae bacterium]